MSGTFLDLLRHEWTVPGDSANKETGHHNCPYKDDSHFWLLAGVPDEVVQRAATVLEDIHSKRPIRRMICDKLVAKDQQYQVLTCTRV